MTTMTKMERAAKTEKRRINGELRELYKERKPLLTGAYLSNWWGVPYCGRPCGDAQCEGCATRAYLQELAEPLTRRIEELKANRQQLDPEPTTRPAVVITGRGEQLVMFV